MTQIRLTKKMREDIINRIMNDVPKQDYRSKATDLLVKGIQSNLPKEIQALLGTSLREHLISARIRIASPKGYYVAAYIPGALPTSDVPNDVREEILALLNKQSEQDAQRQKLEIELESIFASFSTVEKVRDKFPQFDKYLPNVEKSTFPIAVVSNVLNDLQQAGWPKEGKKP